MNRYDITNLDNGTQYRVTAEVFPPRHPFWGNPAGTKLKEACDAWELANGVSAGMVNVGTIENPVMKEAWAVKDAMQVVTTNIDAEIAADQAKDAAFAAKVAALKALTKPDVTTFNQLRDMVFDLTQVFLRSLRKD